MLTPYESNIPRPISPLAGVVANIMNTPKVAELDDKQWRARQQALRETELALADAREDDRAGIAEAYAGTRDWTAVDDDSDDDDDDDARWREGGRWRERRRPDEETATYAEIPAPSNVDTWASRVSCRRSWPKFPGSSPKHVVPPARPPTA